MLGLRVLLIALAVGLLSEQRSAGSGILPLERRADDYLLEVQRLGEAGRVWSVGDAAGAIDCPGRCRARFEAGVIVKLRAHGGTFDGWRRDCYGTYRYCTVVLAENTVVEARFARHCEEDESCALVSPALRVTVSKGGGMKSTPDGIKCRWDCHHNFKKNTVITLKPIRRPGYHVKRWSGVCYRTKLTKSCRFTMPGVDKGATVVFEKDG